MSHATYSSNSNDIRLRLLKLIEHFEHILPAQAPIKDFVHHNTLHGFQHLPFDEALTAAEEINGAYGYLPEERYRQLFRDGRITLDDLQRVIASEQRLQPREQLFKLGSGEISRGDVYTEALIHPLKPVTACQLSWQVEELGALQRFQPDVSGENRKRLLESARNQGIESEAEAISDLWSSCLTTLGLEHYILHPEELLDLSPEEAESMMQQLAHDESEEEPEQLQVHRQARSDAKKCLTELLDRVGSELTLRGVLLALTGEDIHTELRPLLIRYLAAYLDQGMAAWHSADRSLGFYATWRNSAYSDYGWVFDELPEWKDELEILPDEPLEAVIIELKRLGLEESKWEAYLERLALEIPGWSGMFLWRHLHPGYEGQDEVRIQMIDYLAVRLVLERLFAQHLCAKLWKIEASLDVIRWYFRRRSSEFLVRHTLYNSRLPEYLANLAQRQVERARSDNDNYAPWQQLADMVWTWRQSPAADQPEGYTVYRSAWPLFRLAQHLGLSGADIRIPNSAQIDAIFESIEQLTPALSGFIWLRAYENHYRDQLFGAVARNHGRGRWASREQRPEAQVVFCIDDREEGIRRHLEELNPSIETLGAAGFFGVAINWRGHDDERVTPLCPVVVTPAHEINEMVAEPDMATKQRHNRRRSLRIRIKELIFQGTRRNLITAPLLIVLAAPLTLLTLCGKSFAPRQHGKLIDRLRNHFDRSVPTYVAINAESSREATPAHPRPGFSDSEQADRVFGFLRAIGLQRQLSPLVVMMGHGSMSQNNPHLAAYDCGACSGRHGGPNARVFAAMANRPEIRSLLAERGVTIPDDTWFIGAEHNTCDEVISWYDANLIPASLRSCFEKLQQEIDKSAEYSAHERCRRLASAPRQPNLKQALKHIVGRAYDFSQARPELGHATNAAAFIGRRSLSQGAFFDRRVFLISYDPTQDPEGAVLEATLLTAGPVGAGINLEYYFSTVSNEQYGSGSKITHNVTGLLGVMDGTSGDLRTGLPRQMIEVHEAMRLQVLVEAKTETLTAIYQRQPPLQELVGNGWLLLAAKDPDSEAIDIFDPAEGWVRWHGTSETPLPTVKRSGDWYSGHSEPLTPALIDSEAPSHG